MAQQGPHEQLLASLKVLVAETCKTGSVESQLDAQGITVKLRFDKAKAGNLEFAKQVAALLAQETM